MRTAGRWLLLATICVVACDGDATAPSPAPSTQAAAPRDDRSLCATLCEHVADCGSRKDFPGVEACTTDCATDPRQTADPPFIYFQF